MPSPTDPNKVQLTGENSFIQLLFDEGGDATTRASHWRVLLSPAGPGHALFLATDLMAGEPRIYSDNIALVRWLQEGIQGSMTPDYRDTGIPVIGAEFEKSGDARSFWTETVESDEDIIDLTWYDFGEPFMVSLEPGSVPDRSYGVYSCLVPARRAQVTIDGEVAQGTPFPKDSHGNESSTCCLEFSETWVGG